MLRRVDVDEPFAQHCAQFNDANFAGVVARRSPGQLRIDFRSRRGAFCPEPQSRSMGASIIREASTVTGWFVGISNLLLLCSFARSLIGIS
jgi:hypothetical protein